LGNNKVIRILTQRKRLFTGLLIAVSIVVVFSLSAQFNLFNGFQLKLGDNLFKAAGLSPKAEEEDSIVIVAIDDKSLDSLGNFSSWPRSYHAQLVDVLAEAGARVIVFDILFAEPASGDDELLAAIDRADNIILPFVYTSGPQSTWSTEYSSPEYNMVRPLESFEQESLAVGHALMLPDDDGIVRRVPLVISNGGNYEPSLALSTVAKYLRRPQIIESPVVDNNLSFAGRSIVLDESDNMLINYTDRGASPLNFRFVSYVDVLSDESLKSGFQDKIVMIGVTATALGDKFWTPMGYLKSGVELHASAVQTILTGNFIKPCSSFTDIIAIVLMVGLMTLVVMRFRVLWATVSVVLLCLLYFFVAFSLFDNGFMLNMLHPPLAMLAAFVCLNINNVVYERAEKNEVIRTFGRYTFPPLVEKILKASKEDRLKLGGETHEVTVMFIDARRFTSISENISSTVVVKALNAYFGVIIGAIKDCGGMVTGFGGDSVMAIWNVPLENSNHARLAVEAATRAQYDIDRLLMEGSVPLVLEFGIGINTGEAVAGNMGSEGYLQYSVIGDSVNVAARLASEAPGGKIWVGENTLTKLEGGVDALPLAPLAVKGRHEPVNVFEIKDLLDCITTDASYLD
jgi:adenylate cyclase